MLSMLGSLTTPDQPAARDDATSRVAFQVGNPVGVRDKALSRLNGQPRLDPLRGSSPCRRFALPLAEHDARLGGDVTRYVFIVEDLHLLLLAGLPAHYQSA
jgi:hypothetical protein